MDHNQQFISELFIQLMESRESPQNSTSSIPNISSTYTAPVNSGPSGSSNPLDYTNTIPGMSSNRMFTDELSRNNVRSQYPWVDTKLIDDIALDTFDIHSIISKIAS